MPDAALRGRVKRLLSGTFLPQDLMWLFLFLRGRPYGRETVREIGDFVAHAEERFKGITTQAVRDFFTFIRFRAPTIILDRPIDLGNVPENFPEILKAGFRRMNSAIIKQDTGLKQSVAHKLLLSLITRFVPLPNGNLIMQYARPEEFELLKCILGHISVTPAFTEERVFDEFCGALLKNGLLLPGETKEISPLKPAITLFAVSVMHQCRVDLGDEHDAFLAASAEVEPGISVYAQSTIPLPSGERGHVGASIFSTSLKASDWCEPTLLEEGGPHPWTCPIELTALKTLSKLG